MKLLAPFLIAIVIMASCKKDNIDVSSNKYDITFTASKSVPKMIIIFNQSNGKIDSQLLSGTGLTFAYGNVKSGTQLFCTAIIDTPNTGYFKCSWAIKDELKKVDSVWMDENTKTFTSEFTF
jgi:hypothetical protein